MGIHILPILYCLSILKAHINVVVILTNRVRQNRQYVLNRPRCMMGYVVRAWAL